MIFDLARYGKLAALIAENGEMVTYDILADMTERIGLMADRRQLVFCFCQNSIGAIAGYIAFLNYGIVPVLLDCKLDKVFLNELMSIYKPALLWIPEDRCTEFAEFEKVGSVCGYAMLKSGWQNLYELHADLALLLTTSGSTGSPKLVRQSYNNVIANTQAIVKYLGIRPDDRAITTLPMQYTYGLSIIQTHLFQGATLILTEKSFMQKEFWELMKRERVTSFSGVPYTYEMLQRLRFFQMKLPYLKVMTQAGGKLSPLLHKKFAEYAEQNGEKFIVMYGAAEATARMSYLPQEKSIEKYGSIGVAIPGGRFVLVDENEVVIDAPDIVGELVYYGDNVVMGYAICSDDLAKDDEWRGMLKTGDLAKRDGDGYYYIVGRKKRFLKLFGKRISLDEVDQLLKQQFQCIDIACDGVDDKMYIFCTEPTVATGIKSFIAAKMMIHPSAFIVQQIKEIPKNDSGKIQYKELVKYYEHI